MLRKFLLIFLLVTVALMGSQTSRVNSLSGFESHYSYGSLSEAPLGRASIYDPEDVILFPHLSNKYSDFVNVFYAGPNSYSAFSTFNIMDGLTLGLVDYNTSKQFDGLHGVTDQDGNSLASVNHAYGIFAAYGLGSMDLGLSLNYWKSSLKQEVVTLNTTTNVNDTVSRTIGAGIFSLKFSLGMELGEDSGFDSLFNIDLGSFTNENYASTQIPKTRLNNRSDAYLSLSLGGRYFMNLSSSVRMTAWGFFDYNNQGYSDIAYNTENKSVDTVKHTDSKMLINLGSSFDISMIKDKLTVTPHFGLLISSSSDNSEDLAMASKGSKNEASLLRMAIPYLGFSIQYNVKKWFTIYSGYNKLVFSDSTKEYQLAYNNNAKQGESTTTIESGFTTSNFALGLSFQNDLFKFIATLNKQLLTNGPNFISGTTTPMFLNATLQYKFGAPKQKITTED